MTTQANILGYTITGSGADGTSFGVYTRDGFKVGSYDAQHFEDKQEAEATAKELAQQHTGFTFHVQTITDEE